MKNKIIFSSMLILLLSGCSSKISSLNLKNNQNEKHDFLKKMDLNSAEVIFEIKDNKVNVLDVGSQFSKNDLNLYKKNNEDTSCLLISTNGNRPCSISKRDDIFYKKDFSFAKSISTTIMLPVALAVDTIKLVFLDKPKTTITALKHGYTNKVTDGKNMEMLGNTIENILLKEKSFKRLSNNEIFSYFNNHTVNYQSGEEYHSPNSTTYYKDKKKDLRKGTWNIENNQICYKYNDDPKKYCHNRYLYKNKYMSSNLEKDTREVSDSKGLKVEYEKMILKKERRKQEQLEKKKRQEKEKRDKYERTKNCQHVYIGKVFKQKKMSLWSLFGYNGNLFYDKFIVIGVSKELGKATIKKTKKNWTGEVHCSEIPE